MRGESVFVYDSFCAIMTVVVCGGFVLDAGVRFVYSSLVQNHVGRFVGVPYPKPVNAVVTEPACEMRRPSKASTVAKVTAAVEREHISEVTAAVKREHISEVTTAVVRVP